PLREIDRRHERRSTERLWAIANLEQVETGCERFGDCDGATVHVCWRRPAWRWIGLSVGSLAAHYARLHAAAGCSRIHRWHSRSHPAAPWKVMTWLTPQRSRARGPRCGLPG